MMTRQLFRLAIFSRLRLALIVGMPLIVGLSTIYSHQAQSNPLSRLGNGRYQMCSQPPPKDWQQGAGVCLVFRKQNDSSRVGQGANRIEGYYGYPHSDAFVCLRGAINRTQLTGQGYLVSWEGSPWSNSSTKPFFWDREQHLLLEQGKQIRSQPQSRSEMDQILFQKATLNLRSFYLYQDSQMISPEQLCDWSFEQQPSPLGK